MKEAPTSRCRGLSSMLKRWACCRGWRRSSSGCGACGLASTLSLLVTRLGWPLRGACAPAGLGSTSLVCHARRTAAARPVPIPSPSGWIGLRARFLAACARHLQEGTTVAEEIRAEIVGNVLKVVATQGEDLGIGDTLVILESMKM